jgi:hypothetical protein
MPDFLQPAHAKLKNGCLMRVIQLQNG